MDAREAHEPRESSAHRPDSSGGESPRPREAVLWNSGVVSGNASHELVDGRDAHASALKTCTHCGNEYDAHLKFCPDDGAVLRGASADGDLIGCIIADRYHILSRLGAGGMGQVYLASHVRLGRRCALKVLKVALLDDVDAVARFDREAANASRITHPNVATVYDFGEAGNGVVYLAMEFVDGEPLTELLRREHVVPPRRARSIICQIADGLSAAHQLGIVHRDLKPDNIMLGRNRDGTDCVKVVDFGIAKGTLTDSQRITATGLIVGTPAYMSPEQLAGDAVDRRSDIYSLGLIAFQLFTGALPFPEGRDALLARLALPPRTMTEVNGDVRWPAELQDTLRRVLAVNPGNRYDNVEDFARALTRALDRWQPSGAIEGAANAVGTADEPRTAADGAHVHLRMSAGKRPLALVTLGAVLVLAAAAIAFVRASSRSDPSSAAGSPVAAKAAADSSPAASPARAEGSRTAGAAAGSSATTSNGVVSTAASRPPLTSAPPSVIRAGPAPSAVADGTLAAIRGELTRLRALTDPLSGTEENARVALREIAALLPQVTNGADSVEAQYYGVHANMLLGETEAACRTLRRIEPRAAANPYLANAIRGFLADSAFQCP